MSLTASDLSQIKSIMKDFPTKDDLKNVPTRDDLKSFATKDDLKSFATKDDLAGLATKASLKDLATKADLKSLALATKNNLDRMESRLIAAIGLLERDSFSRLDQHETRITHLENAH